MVIYLFAKKNTKKLLKISGILILFFLATCIILIYSPLAGIIKSCSFKIILQLFFTGSFLPEFSFFYVVPLPIIILALFGIYFIYKNKKWLFWQFILGIFLWIFYTFSVYIVIIGYERVAFFTSIIIVLIAGFGISNIEKYFELNFKSAFIFLKRAEVAVIFIFLLLIISYTQKENWMSLTYINYSTGAGSMPMAPANNYLTQEDLRIFKNIKNSRFLSIPWKGTVIGVATGNYPVITKGGTITMSSNDPILYQEFLNYDCAKKYQIAKKINTEYVYSSPFSCQNFQKIDQSSEGFVLYKFN